MTLNNHTTNNERRRKGRVMGGKEGRSKEREERQESTMKTEKEVLNSVPVRGERV